MNVRSMVISLVLTLGWGLPLHLWGQTVEFDEGTISIGFGTNILNKSGSPVYFTTKKNPELDFSGVEDPQIFVVFQNVKWKKDFSEDGYYFVSKSDWIKESGGVLQKSGSKNVKTKSKAKRKVYFKVLKNGTSEIKLDFGVMKPDDNNQLGSVKKIPAKTITKSFKVLGIGAPESVVNIANTEPEKPGDSDSDPTSANPQSENIKTPDNPTVKIDPATPENNQIVNSTSEPAKTPKETPKASAKPKKDNKEAEEETLWKETEKAGSYTMYEKYIKSYPKGKYLSEAGRAVKKTKIKWEFKEQREEEGQYFYKVRLSDVKNAELGDFDPDVFEAFLSKNTVSVLIKVPGKQELTVSDDYGRETTIVMNPQFKILQAIFTDVGDVINYEIWGGEAPYFIRLVDATTDRWVCDNNRVEKLAGEVRATGAISKEEWATQICNLNGNYKFEVQDRRKTEAIYPDEQFLFEGKSNAGTYFVLLSFVLIPLIGMGFLFMNKKKKEKESEAFFKKHEQKKKDQSEKQYTSTPKQTEKPVEKVVKKKKENEEITKTVEIEEKIKELPSVNQEELLPLTNVNGDKKPKINVIRKKGQQQQAMVHNADDYHRIPLEKIWYDTAISEVCFSRECIFAIDEFIRKENRQGIDEDNNAVPEVGGFLLGNHAFVEDDGQYKIYLEKFVPITPEENDVYKVEFGVEAWMELDNVKDQYPDYMLLGWFHTHPGHSLFLSQPDLKIHEGFFKQNFQLAMEIDTLSENLDTGFFVRTKNGQINNTRDMKEGEDWYSWMEIEKFLRKKRV